MLPPSLTAGVLPTGDVPVATSGVVPTAAMMQGTVSPPPSAKLIHELFADQAGLTPDAVAVEENGVVLTYAQLDARANQLAHDLVAKGVGPNVLVGVLLERSADVIVSIYAVLKAGGAYVPLDPSYPQDRLIYMIETARAAVLISQERFVRSIAVPSSVHLVCLDRDVARIQTYPTRAPSTSVGPNDLIYVIFTSGSTGRPKGAAVYHRGFSNLLHWFTTEFSVTAADRILLVSSLSFDLTQKNLYASLIKGGSIHIYPPGPYDVSLLSRLIQQHGITLLNCTPSAFYPLIEPATDESLGRLASLRAVFLGGEPISVPRLRPWFIHPACRSEVANTYGPTECTDICGAYRLNRVNMDAYPFVPLGRPVYNVQLAIVSPELALQPIGTPGELCVAGAGVGAGYLNDADLTASKFIPNPFSALSGEKIYRTGDQARWLPDGVIEFLGRLDYQVKIRGFRIELHEIEAAMDAYDEIREAIVVVKEGAGGGDPRLVGFFTTKTGATPAPEALRTFLSARLPEYMIPASLNHLPTFPLSPNGKVDRRALREMPETASAVKAGVAVNEIEAKIRAVWLEVLGRVDADLDANFFDLGGDSIQLARIHVALQSALGRTFPITDLFAHTTIRALAIHFNPAPASAGKTNAIQERARLQREAANRRTPRR